jgi:hypothetical protein
MATRGKRSRKNPPARKARRPAPRKDRGRRAAAGPAAVRRSAAPIPSRSVSPISRMAPELLWSSAGWSTLRVFWRPAIAMATLPYRVYRVYRWAEAESSRSAAASNPSRAQ